MFYHRPADFLFIKRETPSLKRTALANYVEQ